MKCIRTTIAVFLLSLLSACSSSFFYNQLDWLIPWYVGDYVDLTRDQKISLKQQLEPLLRWHRGEELGSYLILVDSIEQDLAGPISSDTVQGWIDAGTVAMQRLEAQVLPLAFDMGEQLSGEQMQEFLEKLWDKQAELEEEYLERDEQEYVEESYDNFAENLQEFLGKLEPEQKQRIREASASLLRFDTAWLAERRAWLDLLQRVLTAREPGWQEQIRQANAQREGQQSAEYRDAYLHNQRVINAAIADVLNARSDKQSAHLKEEIADLRKLLRKLIAQAD